VDKSTTFEVESKGLHLVVSRGDKGAGGCPASGERISGMFAYAGGGKVGLTLPRSKHMVGDKRCLQLSRSA
jgi:hypothetical protein